MIPVKCDAKKNNDVYILSIATSTTSAPAAAHASMLAAAMPAVSWEWTWMGRSGWAFLMAPMRLWGDIV